MAGCDFSERDVAVWLSRRPGTFEADSENKVWRKAWHKFADKRYPKGQDLAFMMMVNDAGFDVRPTALGGYILDAVPES